MYILLAHFEVFKFTRSVRQFDFKKKKDPRQKKYFIGRSEGVVWIDTFLTLVELGLIILSNSKQLWQILMVGCKKIPQRRFLGCSHFLGDYFIWDTQSPFYFSTPGKCMILKYILCRKKIGLLKIRWSLLFSYLCNYKKTSIHNKCWSGCLEV